MTFPDDRSSYGQGYTYCFRSNAAALCGQAGFLLGWRPDEFWNATPAELECVLQAMVPHGDAPLDADIINKLREQFPDG